MTTSSLFDPLTLKDHIVPLLFAGHDIGFNADITIFPLYSQAGTHFRVEIYDPIDEDTGLPMQETFIGCPAMQKFWRSEDWWDKQFDNVEEAVALYLEVCNWLSKSSRP